MKVAILLGSIREGRQSHKVAFYLKKKLEERNIVPHLIDLKENQLQIYGEKSAQSRLNVERIKEISKRLQEADALIFVTPEYHGSFSGALKNALDYFWSEFQKKPIGVATISAGRMGGINASIQLQHVILSLGAYPLPIKFLVPEIQNAFDASNYPLKDSMVNSANKFLNEFLWFTEAIMDRKKKEVQLFKSS